MSERSVIVAQLQTMKSELTAELRRVERALQALTDGAEDALPAVRTKPKDGRRGRAQSRYVQAAALGIMEEADRDWGAADLLHEMKERGQEIVEGAGKDPARPVRSALNSLERADKVVKIDVGRYKAKKWAVATFRLHVDENGRSSVERVDDAILVDVVEEEPATN